MTRSGVDIREHPLKDAVDPGIAYATSFAEWEAGTAAGLDMWRWEANGYPMEFKARVLAWFGLHGLVKAHSEDAVNRKAARKSKRG